MIRTLCLILQVITPHYHKDTAVRNMIELEQLVATVGGEIVEKSVQHRQHPHPSTYIGAGKVDWLIDAVREKNISVVIINDIVKAGQLFRLEKALWAVNTRIQVWDRVDLILHIFERHAVTREAKLQIERARIQHSGPRIYGLGHTELSRQGGGIGTRGLGETNIERERRVSKKLQQQIDAELRSLSKKQLERVQQRQNKGIKTAALVGYTSAGKSTLFSVLTQKYKESASSLFTTLDSTVGKLKVPEFDPGILISDTIGFIDELPPVLISAFHTTLLESLHARLLLHVVDLHDARYAEKIIIVENILADLGVVEPPVLIFNKTDLTTKKTVRTAQTAYSHRSCFFVSAQERTGITELKNYLVAQLHKTL